MLLSPCSRTVDVLFFSPLLITAQILLSAWGLGERDRCVFEVTERLVGKNIGKFVPSELLTEMKTLAMNWQIISIVPEVSEML